MMLLSSPLNLASLLVWAPISRWWIHLIVLIVVVLTVTLPLVYVGYPRIAQSGINDATLNVTSLIFANPKPNSVDANQTQVLGSKSIFHPKIYPFNATFGLAGLNVPVTWATVPEIHANDGAVINMAATLPLYSLDAATDFTTAILTGETFGLNLYGKPSLKEGSLPTTTATFNKTITMKGLNKLDGFDLYNVKISLTQAPDGTNMNGTVYIPNPSVLTMSLGRVTLNILANGTQIGYSYIDDLTLVPGNNTLFLKSTIDQTKIISLAFGPNAPYPSGIVPVDIVGNSSIYNGQEIEYYSRALQSNKLRFMMNLTQVLQMILD